MLIPFPVQVSCAGLVVVEHFAYTGWQHEIYEVFS